MQKRTISGVTFLVLVSLILSACGDATTPTASSTSVPTTTTQAGATVTTIPATSVLAGATTATTADIPPGATLVQAGPNSKETKLLKAVVPDITATLDALKKSDVAGAKNVFKEYSYAWNGIEVYVNSRSRELYDTIEVQNEFKVNDLFDKPGSKAEEIITYVEGVQKGFNEAIKMAETGPAYNAVLDEIADLRIVRIDLSKSIAALGTGDIASARGAFEKFDNGWDSIEGSVKPRSKELYKETEKWIDRVAQLYKVDKPSAADLTEAENKLISTYNRSVTMLNTIRTTGKVPTKEVVLLQSVTPSISATLTALKKGDIKTARANFQVYSYGWNGIEVYVKTRSAQLYDTIEVQNEAKANVLLESATPNPQEIIPFVEGVQKGYNDALNLALSGQPLSPILDEVADMRILRVNLTKTLTALKDNNISNARNSFQEFKSGWQDVEQSVSSRNKDAALDINSKLTRVSQSLLQSDKPVTADVIASTTELQTSYNNGLKVLTDTLNK